jgi:hypothetical protein
MSVAIDTADVDAQKEAFDAECVAADDEGASVAPDRDDPVCYLYSG